MNGNQEESNKKLADIYFRKVLTESSNSGKTEQELIDEGLWDRMKARGAGIKGAAKGLKNRAASEWDRAKAVGTVAKSGIKSGIEKGKAKVSDTWHQGNLDDDARAQKMAQNNDRRANANQMSSNARAEAEKLRNSAKDKRNASENGYGIEKQKAYVNSIAKTVIKDLQKLKLPLKNDQDLLKQLKNLIWKNLEFGNEEYVGTMLDMRDKRNKSNITKNRKTAEMRNNQRR